MLDIFIGNSCVFEIEVDVVGCFVYVFNCGDDSIVVFCIDVVIGLLYFVGVDKMSGCMLCFFFIVLGGCFLYVLNEDSDIIVVFGIDLYSGCLCLIGYSV